MRLLHTTELILKEFNDTTLPEYAILSHCWSQDPDQPEVTYQDFIASDGAGNGYGWNKIKRCCRLAASRGYDWTWIDTCCIDKSSSAELSETINSMFAWYKRAAECYVFLDDFHESVVDAAEDSPTFQCFKKCRWFERGWTLQELLAPPEVLFYNSRDGHIGTKYSLARQLKYATNVNKYYLKGWQRSHRASVAERMHWASRRTTTRIEDRAYSLLGIFNVNMPLLYGEGEKAFMRLQREIIAQSYDLSIFAWLPPGGSNQVNWSRVRTGWFIGQESLTGVLASSPTAFHHSLGLPEVPLERANDNTTRPYTLTNLGIEMWISGVLPADHPSGHGSRCQVDLRCRGVVGSDVCLLLTRVEGQWWRTGLLIPDATLAPEEHPYIAKARNYMTVPQMRYAVPSSSEIMDGPFGDWGSEYGIPHVAGTDVLKFVAVAAAVCGTALGACARGNFAQFGASILFLWRYLSVNRATAIFLLAQVPPRMMKFSIKVSLACIELVLSLIAFVWGAENMRG